MRFFLSHHLQLINYRTQWNLELKSPKFGRLGFAYFRDSEVIDEQLVIMIGLLACDSLDYFCSHGHAKHGRHVGDGSVKRFFVFGAVSKF
jgi:hypothetical protein